MVDCIFCKIINKEIPSLLIYEDEKVIAWLDNEDDDSLFADSDVDRMDEEEKEESEEPEKTEFPEENA